MKPRTVLAHRFELLARVRRGGEGQVFRGRDLLTEQPVAIKILHEEAGTLERFEREVLLLTEFTHPGIVRYVAHSTEGQHRYLVMEWVEGKTLSQILQQGLTLQESVDVTRRIAEALGVVHEQGMVHRDIKPSNIMFVGGNFEQVKLLDFGIARIVGQQSFTRTGMVVGTPGYMAPEQVRGQRDVDASADVFALGCVLYACMCGQPPFTSQHKLATLASILFLDPIPIVQRCPEAPAALVALVAHMLAKEPSARPADAEVVVRELTALGTLPESPRRAQAAHGPGKAEPHGAPTWTTRTYELAVDTSGAQPPVFVLAAIDGDATERDPVTGATRDGELLERITRAEEIAAEHEGASSHLMDGLFVAVFAGTPDRAARAARCALALRRELPHVPMVMGSGSITSSGSMLDRMMETLVEESFQRVAGNADEELPATGIRLEDKLADELTGTFEILHSGTAEYLVASRS
jgi:eukaryotic-like serine/threonine-protein kinase